jgi:hypothetical protein
MKLIPTNKKIITLKINITFFMIRHFIHQASHFSTAQVKITDTKECHTNGILDQHNDFS